MRELRQDEGSASTASPLPLQAESQGSPEAQVEQEGSWTAGMWCTALLSIPAAVLLFWCLDFVVRPLLPGVHGGLPGLPACAWPAPFTSAPAWLPNGPFLPSGNSSMCRDQCGAISTTPGYAGMFSDDGKVSGHGVWLNSTLGLLLPTLNQSAWDALLPGCWDLRDSGATKGGPALVRCVESCRAAGLDNARILLNPACVYNMFVQVHLSVCAKASVALWAHERHLLRAGVIISLSYLGLSVLTGLVKGCLRGEGARARARDRVLKLKSFLTSPPWSFARCLIPRMPVSLLFGLDMCLSGSLFLFTRWMGVISIFIYWSSGQLVYAIIILFAIVGAGDWLQHRGMDAWLASWRTGSATMELMKYSWGEAFSAGAPGVLVPGVFLLCLAQMDGGDVDLILAVPLFISMCSSLYSVKIGAVAIELHAILEARSQCSLWEGQEPSHLFQMAALMKLRASGLLQTLQVLRVCEVLSLLPLFALIPLHASMNLVNAVFTGQVLPPCACFSAAVLGHPLEPESIFFGSLPPLPPADRPLTMSTLPARMLAWPAASFVALVSQVLAQTCDLSWLYMGPLDVDRLLRLKTPGKVIFSFLLGVGVIAFFVQLYILRFWWTWIQTSAAETLDVLKSFSEEDAVKFLEDEDVIEKEPMELEEAALKSLENGTAAKNERMEEVALMSLENGTVAKNERMEEDAVKSLVDGNITEMALMQEDAPKSLESENAAEKEPIELREITEETPFLTV